jgi:hypothetical protein
VRFGAPRQIVTVPTPQGNQMLVRLSSDRKGAFRRSVKDNSGKVVSVLEWQPRQVLEITDEASLRAISGDLGYALVEVQQSDLVTPVHKPQQPEPPTEPFPVETEEAVTTSSEPMNPMRQRKGGKHGSHSG